MTHRWKVGGSSGQWVEHSSRESGGGSDCVGVGYGEDFIGPFSTRKVGGRYLAEIVAGALNNAYAAGLRDGRTALFEDLKEALEDLKGAEQY